MTLLRILPKELEIALFFIHRTSWQKRRNLIVFAVAGVPGLTVSAATYLEQGCATARVGRFNSLQRRKLVVFSDSLDNNNLFQYNNNMTNSFVK